MNYCQNCVQPSTRPGIQIMPDGVCNACHQHQSRPQIDWAERKSRFEAILDRIRGHKPKGYDCIVPVSGGKDSIYQVWLLKYRYGMTPLCVTYRTPARTPLGEHNLNCLRAMGVAHLDFSFNPEVEKKLLSRAVLCHGAAGIPLHMGMYAVSMKAALDYKIQLMFWGESPHMEYGGTAEDIKNPSLDRAWIIKYGCLQDGLARDYVDADLSFEDMLPFDLPSDRDLAEAELKSLFLGYYFPWDPQANYALAKQFGFKNREAGPVMGIYDYADLDCYLIPLHHFTKWYKFGMGRTFDNVSVEIRNGRMTREEGIEKIRRHQDRLGHENMEFLQRFTGITRTDFIEAMHKFRNPKVWQKDQRGLYYIPEFITGQPLYEEEIEN